MRARCVNLTGHQMNTENIKQEPEVLDPGQASDDEDRMSEADIVIPRMCPGLDCSDPVPDKVSPQLRTALIHHVHLSQENKSDVRLAMDICIVIKREHKRLEYIKLAAEKKWPTTTIDFQGIPNRVLEMYDELKKIMFIREA